MIMVIIVSVQVFTRKLFSFVLFWPGEITLLLLAWFTYMGSAIGFREKLHLKMDLLAIPFFILTGQFFGIGGLAVVYP